MDLSALHPTASTTWHICWQAAMGRDLLADPPTVARMRARLLQAHRQRGRELFFYLLTPSEIHLLSALPEGESPRDIAWEVANVIARWVRRAHGERGPVFAGRYLAHRVDGIEALRDDVRFLTWRPVALGLCRTASHYSHSAFRATVGLSAKDGFDVLPLWGLFGASKHEARVQIRMRLSRRPSAIEVREWELNHSLTRAAGACGPWGNTSCDVKGAAAALVAASGSAGIDGALRLLEHWVAVRLGLHDGKPVSTRRGAMGARARALVASLAVACDLCSAVFVARHFGRAKATLSEQMSACGARPADRTILSLPMDQIVQEAVALAGPIQ
ncbi:hypothetical protein [Roseateles sp.]|uniref:hypothetical protein n=1 Tax=Roseateles sp. TaxID=1971397 RepID=UPI003BAB1FD1